MNAGLGGGPAVPVTAHEEHIFARKTLEVPLKRDKNQKEQLGGTTFPIHFSIPSERTCSCTGPPQEGILPSIPLQEGTADRSSVRWRVKVEIKRKGLLKRDIK
jgi:hypothetical protein